MFHSPDCTSAVLPDEILEGVAVVVSLPLLEKQGVEYPGRSNKEHRAGKKAESIIMDMKATAITIGVQTTREDDRTEEPILEMRRLLALHCKGPYSSEIREFALILRVGGEMQEFNFEGCDSIRRNRVEKYITVDLGYPANKWKGATDSSIREYISQAVQTGLLCCIRRLEKDKSALDADQLMADFRKAKQVFLAGSLGGKP